MKNAYVLFDDVSQEIIDVILANTTEQAVTTVENQIENLTNKFGNKFKFRLKLYHYGTINLKDLDCVKKFSRGKF